MTHCQEKGCKIKNATYSLIDTKTSFNVVSPDVKRRL